MIVVVLMFFSSLFVPVRVILPCSCCCGGDGDGRQQCRRPFRDWRILFLLLLNFLMMMVMEHGQHGVTAPQQHA